MTTCERRYLCRRTIAPLVDAIGEVASRGSGRSFAVPMPVPASPRRLTSRATEYDRIFAHRSDMDRVRAALKDVLLGQLELRRQLSSLAGDEAQLSDEVEHTGPRGLDPRVSVILTVYELRWRGSQRDRERCGQRLRQPRAGGRGRAAHATIRSTWSG